MNDFDRFLEMGLRRMLDPVVESPPPSRKARRKKMGTPLMVVMTVPLELSVDAMAGPAEPVAIPVPVTAAVIFP